MLGISEQKKKDGIERIYNSRKVPTDTLIGNSNRNSLQNQSTFIENNE